MNVAEPLALLAAFCSGVIFLLSASRPVREARRFGSAGEAAAEPQGRPIIGAPPGWKR